MGIEIERFFGGVIDSNENNIRFETADIVLLSGPTLCGKTSLLFQYGYTYAKQGYNVLFICNKKKFQQSLPFLPIGFIKDDFILKKLKIKYIENDVELRNYLFEFPSLSYLPDLILIDDISFYFISSMYERNVTLGKTFAFIKETVQYIKNQKLIKYNQQNNNNQDQNQNQDQDHQNLNNNNNNNNNNKNMDCIVIVSDISVMNNDSSNTSTTTTTATAADQSQSHPIQQVQKIQVGNVPTFISPNHPKFLFILQRWTSLVITINEILSINDPPPSTLPQQPANTPQQQQPYQQHYQHQQPSHKKYILSILKYKDANNPNFLKDYTFCYNVKYQGQNHQNNSFSLDSIQIPKQTTIATDDNESTQPL
ncbi:hypothetical protein DDB_G0287071 [Dictyostelium discoideum AX4]|uniref:Uncharacterized protein n=1 Tax=Dictyostelium discoideum TaxID=44689 RepID=Q54KV9_DICDI|nr:hypothetical protein DDB_G0287071 [Dictyostelium discoideum AX4]EAL63900.1 hypothetical protein DDB_G0287071 [Dictyostelium discoideum AX4]|eukprot:XP_637411.1 hypothetical protein DDB_G0287071 [Dictyostelium discoideum AX4]